MEEKQLNEKLIEGLKSLYTKLTGNEVPSKEIDAEYEKIFARFE